MSEQPTSYTVTLGIGREYPGNIAVTVPCPSRDTMFTTTIRQAYQRCSESLAGLSDDDFVWIGVQDADGNCLFEREDELTEWLDEALEE